MEIGIKPLSPFCSVGNGKFSVKKYKYAKYGKLSKKALKLYCKCANLSPTKVTYIK